MITANLFKNLRKFRRQQATCSKCTSFCRYIDFRIRLWSEPETASKNEDQL